MWMLREGMVKSQELFTIPSQTRAMGEAPRRMITIRHGQHDPILVSGSYHVRRCFVLS